MDGQYIGYVCYDPQLFINHPRQEIRALRRPRNGTVSNTTFSSPSYNSMSNM
ncbi:hypothetical protein BAUCODRAFT_33453 [Baudoinia panamericana UAMH 10762]|uniref:Uncharacterized protein n=1 Tax=Baudoinia panamericana (strain UAMH 10762) TaxID=717646 RepID=M2NFF9_BAUPA|nr:uncharacterized protein BAUCODRAFT_33453 [Baudoinia panamericana UAMH 10762]EMC97730.1 hypothetical protein BAUCODRAFT_33453 [Baudoinia panamericana UAMH 10762]